MARGGGRTAGGRDDARRRADHDERGRGVAPRPAGVSLQRFSIAAALIAVLVGLDIAFRSGRARWTPARLGRRRRAGQLLRHLPRLPQPQERRAAAAARRAVRPPARRPRSQPVRSATTPPRCCTACSAAGSPRTGCRSSTSCSSRSSRSRVAFALVVLPDLRAGLFFATALALNWALAAAQLLRAAVARADLRRAGRLFAHLPHTGVTACRTPLLERGSTSFATPSAAGARRASARSPRCTSRSSSPPRWRPTCSGSGAREDRAVAPVRPDRRRHRLLRLALRPRRPRRPGHRRDVARPGPGAHRHRPARRAAASARAEPTPA